MKKNLILASFFALLAGNAFSQVQYKVVCCDGTVHYTHGVSKDVLWSVGFYPTEIDEYRDTIGKKVCEGHGSCNGTLNYQYVGEVTPTDLALKSIPDVKGRKSKVEEPLMQRKSSLTQPESSRTEA